MSTRVVWTEEEEQRLIELVVGMRLRHPEPALLVLIQRAQQQLPEERRRKIYRMVGVEALARRIGERLKEVQQAAARDTQPRVVAPAAPVRTPEEVLREISEQDLACLLMNRVLQRLQKVEQALEQLRRGLNGRAAAVEPVPRQQEEVKAQDTKEEGSVKIVVVGLFNEQIQEVSARAGKLARLHFIRQDVKQVRYPECDWCVIVTKFVTHRVLDQAREQLGRERVLMHEGAVSSLVELIKKLAAGGKQAARS